MPEKSRFTLLKPPETIPASECLKTRRGSEQAEGLLEGARFVEGNQTLLILARQEDFPFSLHEILVTDDAERISGWLRNKSPSACLFELSRDGNRYEVTISRSKGAGNKWFWHMTRLEEDLAGNPVVGIEQRYQRLFENVKDAIFASTVEGRFLDINPAGVEMLGYASKDEVLKLNILTDLYYYPEDRLKYQKIIAEKGYVKDYEVVFKKKDRTPLFVSMSNVAVYDEDKKILGYEGIFRDLTRQKQIEEELLSKNAQLESYVYTVSHDLKSPIIAIQGFCRLLMKKQGERLDEKGRELLERITEISRRAERMIVDLLAYARTEKDARGEFEFIDTYAVVQSIIEELKIKWGQPVIFVVSKNLPEILFHKESFRQILANLIDNAIKYSRDQASPVVKIDCKVEDGAVVFSVEDNGVGIDPSLHKKIFEVFERGEVSEKVEGTGIGLSIIKRIVETHHGDIWVESQKGKGATFYVRLPVRTLEKTREGDR